jgi:hypothetical protein
MHQLLVYVSIVWTLAGAGASSAAAQAPTVTAVTPDSGQAAGATEVSVEGTGFTPGARVSFAGAPATDVEVTASTSLTALSPPGSGTIHVSVEDAGEISPVDAHDWFAYEPAAQSYWLGLDGNSLSNVYTNEWLGPVNEFSRSGIVYDRSFEFTAGERPDQTESDSQGSSQFEDRLKLDYQNDMIPVSTIEYKGYKGNLTPDPFFPQEERTSSETTEGKTTISEYVAGFVKSATTLLHIVGEKYSGMPVLLEPMNEPWGYTTPQYDGAEYAKVLAKLLPAARAAGIPLSDIYVSAFGADVQIGTHGAAEYFAPGWVAAMYQAEPALKSEIQGWYFHPYGPVSGSEFHDSWGIESVPEVRKQMTSGENNIIVSEIGFCKSDGGDCDDSGQAEVRTREEAAGRLTAMLEAARLYHEAGWLKALIVYSRDDGGWSMQEDSTKGLSKQGEALRAFALAHARGEPPAPQESPVENGGGSFVSPLPGQLTAEPAPRQPPHRPPRLA